MINLFENEKITKEDFLNIVKDKKFNLSAVSTGILNHNKEINDFCIRKQQQFPFIFKTKFNIFHFIANEFTFKQCVTCGKYLNFNQVKRNADFCSMKCAQSSELTNNKRKQASINKYGVENPWQAKEVKEKILKTNMKRYGAKHAPLSDDSKIKISKTLKEYFKEHTIDSPFAKPEIQEKSRKTCLEKYGVENPMQSKEIREKVKKTCLERYGVECVLQSDLFKENQIDKTWQKILSWKNFVIPLFDKTTFKYNEIYKWKCVKCGNEFKSRIYCTHFHKFDQYLPRCLHCYPKKYSVGEYDLINFCKKFYPNLQIRNRTLIKPYELDIVIPELKLALEFNGAYWHSIESGLPLGYHLMKTELCENKGYRLIHIWEDDWNNNQNEIKNKLKNIFENKEVIDYSKPLDRCWYSKINNFDIIPPNIVERLSFHVENCGYLIQKNNFI